MFFKTLYIALAMLVLLLGVLLAEAVLRDRVYAKRLLLGITGIYALGGVSALLFSLAKL
jgi:hypothetical protein